VTVDDTSTADPTAPVPKLSTVTRSRRGAGAVRPGVDYDEIARVLLDEAVALEPRVTVGGAA